MCDVHQPDARCGRPKKRYQIFLGCHQTGKDYDRVSDKVPAGLAVSLVGVLSKVSEYVLCCDKSRHWSTATLANTLVATGPSEVMEYVHSRWLSPDSCQSTKYTLTLSAHTFACFKIGYSGSMDMINQPILQDQLVLYSNESKLAEIVNDVVLNPVIDIPQMRVSSMVSVFSQSSLIRIKMRRIL